MYFYILKSNKNEQAQLLEMRCNAGVNLRDGFSVYSLVSNKTINAKVAGRNTYNLFY